MGAIIPVPVGEIHYPNTGGDTIWAMRQAGYFTPLVTAYNAAVGWRIYELYYGITFQITAVTNGVPTVVPIGEIPPNMPSVFAWYKADVGVYSDAGVTPITTGGTVAQLNDNSPSNFALSSVASVYAPTWNDNVINGLPVLNFAGHGGNNFSLLWSGTFPAAYSQPITFYCVIQLLQLGTSDGLSSYPAQELFDCPNRVLVRSVACNNGAVWQIYASSSLGNVASDLNWHVLTVVINGTTSSIQVDQNPPFVFGATPGANTMNALSLGTYYSGSGTAVSSGLINANILECLWCNAVHTGPQQFAIQKYLRARMGQQ